MLTSDRSKSSHLSSRDLTSLHVRTLGEGITDTPNFSAQSPELISWYFVEESLDEEERPGEGWVKT